MKMRNIMNDGTRRSRVTLGMLMLVGLLLPARGAFRPPPTREAQALWGGDAPSLRQNTGQTASPAAHRDLGATARRHHVG
jgi:hypothetical protein